MTRTHATGNVFTDPDSGDLRTPVNPQNVVARQGSKTTAWGPGAGAVVSDDAPAAPLPPATGTLELDDEGVVVPPGTDIAAKAAESDVREARRAIADLGKQLQVPETAAQARAMLSTVALHEYARPDGGRKTVIAELRKLGALPR